MIKFKNLCRKFGICFVTCALCSIILSIDAMASIETDTSDPLWIPGAMDFITRVSGDYSEDLLRVHANIGYGFTDRLSINASIHYQNNFETSADGFSNVDLNGVYRMSDDDDSRIISDALIGVRFAGDKDLLTPEFTDTVYHAGLRIGRIWSGITLSGTLKTSWIFDSNHGLAFIDFIPEIYFRVTENWRLGLNADLRKATDSVYDEQVVGGKIVRQFGYTQYVLFGDYEFEREQWRGGLRINVLF